MVRLQGAGQIDAIIRTESEFFDRHLRIDTAPYGDGRTLLLAYDRQDDEAEPLLLVYTPDEAERIEAAFHDPRTDKRPFADPDNVPGGIPEDRVEVKVDFGRVDECLRALADGSDVVDKVLERQRELRASVDDGYTFAFQGFAKDGAKIATRPFGAGKVPDEVRRAILRMSETIDPARIEGTGLQSTMDRDAHCMRVIREFVLGDTGATGKTASAE